MERFVDLLAAPSTLPPTPPTPTPPPPPQVLTDSLGMGRIRTDCSCPPVPCIPFDQSMEVFEQTSFSRKVVTHRDANTERISWVVADERAF